MDVCIITAIVQSSAFSNNRVTKYYILSYIIFNSLWCKIKDIYDPFPCSYVLYYHEIAYKVL